MDPARSLRNFKADLTSSNYTQRKKAQSIYNSVKSHAANGNATDYNRNIIFTTDNNSVQSFRSFKMRGLLILGNDICIPSSSSADCSSATCAKPEYYQTYNSMYTVRDGSYNFFELFGEYGLGKNDLCKLDFWKTTGQYIDPENELPPKFTNNYNIGLLDCSNFIKKIKFN